MSINKRSKIDVCETIGFDRDPEFCKITTLKELKEGNLTVKSIINVRVKVIRTLSEPQMVNIFDSNKLCQDLAVADETDTIKLVTWEQLVGQLEIDQSYDLKHVSVRMMYDQFHLTTTSSTLSQKIDDLTIVNIDNCEDMSSNNNNHPSIVAEKIGAEITKYRSCIQCRKNITDSGITAKCGNCGLIQKYLKTNSTVFGSLHLEISEPEGTRVKNTLFSKTFCNK
jgi:hypothetical protein